MKPTISIALITLGLTFRSGAGRSISTLCSAGRGSDCRIVLDFPNGEFCGETVPVDSVRSWYFGDGSTVGNETDMLMGQKYDFGIVVNADAGPKVIPIRFLNPGTAKRFHVQMGAWTGKPSATGTFPFRMVEAGSLITARAGSTRTGSSSFS